MDLQDKKMQNQHPIVFPSKQKKIKITSMEYETHNTCSIKTYFRRESLWI